MVAFPVWWYGNETSMENWPCFQPEFCSFEFQFLLSLKFEGRLHKKAIVKVMLVLEGKP